MVNEVRVCLVGAGRAARVHANTLTAHVPSGKLIAVVDSVTDTLNATADEYGIEKRYA